MKSIFSYPVLFSLLLNSFNAASQSSAPISKANMDLPAVDAGAVMPAGGTGRPFAWYKQICVKLMLPWMLMYMCNQWPTPLPITIKPK